MSSRTSPPYDYHPITDRVPYAWPEGKRLAFYVALNIEHFVPGKPAASCYPGTAGMPVDPLNHGWRDYGTRVGVWRIMELLDALDLRPSVLLNADVCDHYPAIVEAGLERGWAWLGHGRTNSAWWTDMAPDEESAAIEVIVAELTRATGRAPTGWLSPALVETRHTPDLLAKHGFTYSLNWTADDQPYPMNVERGPFISVPYPAEVNDLPACIEAGMSGPEFAELIIDQFEVLREEAAHRPGGVMCVSLHPFVSGVPFRYKHLRRALETIREADDVWFTTSDSIAAWYLEHVYDRAVAA